MKDFRPPVSSGTTRVSFFMRRSDSPIEALGTAIVVEFVNNVLGFYL
jgi:hypothetical protein